MTALVVCKKYSNEKYSNEVGTSNEIMGIVRRKF